MAEISSKSPKYLLAINQREALRFSRTLLSAEGGTWRGAYEKHWDGIAYFENLYWGSDWKRTVYGPLRRCIPNDRMVLIPARMETKSRCAIVILAAARHRHRHGAYPKTVDAIDKDLFPENSIPADPWLRTENIRLIGTTKALIAYGTGPDQTDDKAQVEYIEGEGLPNDIGLTLPISSNR